MKAAILTISDSCYNGKADDKSGPALQNYLENFDQLSFEEIHRDYSPDDKKVIQDIIIKWCDDLKLNLVVTTGGTGLSSRDNTPEAIKEIIEKEAYGIGLKMIMESLKLTPYAILSRPVCGTRKSTLIISLPGSGKAAVECLSFVADVICHAVDLLTDSKERIEATHVKVQNVSEQIRSKVDVSQIARRARKSPYRLISVDEAQRIVFSNSFLMPIGKVKFFESFGFALAECVYALESLPPFPASIKDGYAVLSSDGEGVRTVIGQSCAGTDAVLTKIVTGACIRINTGAPLPPGSDAVVQVEDTELVEESENGKEELKIKINKKPVLGQEIRAIGSDICKGQLILKDKLIVGAAEIGVMASAGIQEVAVYTKPTVAVLSTGNELQDPFTSPLKEGHIYDSNKAALLSLLRQHSLPCIDAGIAIDDQTSLLRAIRKALATADILVTSGGVSMGDKDLLRPVLIEDLGAKIHFAQVFMKPGKPTTFATCNFEGRQKLILGLPGNPVSAIVTAHLYLIPLCRKMSGFSSYNNTIIRCKLSSEFRLDPRPEYHRVTLSWSPGEDLPTAYSTGNQISSRLLSVSSSQALLTLPPSSGELKCLVDGSVVEAILLGF